MTLQWTFVATVLYAEVLLIALLMLPFISPKTWQRVFRSRIASALSAYSGIYFNIFIAILVLLFLESIREMWKYSDQEPSLGSTQADNVHHLKLFRAQRNYYIAGMALFLWLVLKRLVTLIATEATLMAETEASMKQAQSATAAAKQFMEEKVTTDENKKNNAAEQKDLSRVEKELQDVKTDLEKTQEELYKARVDLTSMKKQAESTNQEYDRLLEEHSKLEKKLSILEGSGAEDKKGK